MVYWLLLILKIIGILVLVLIGLLLAILFIVLYAPIRYQFFASYDQVIDADVKVTWLAHIISCRITYHENQVQYRVRIFGISVYPKKKKETLQLRKRKKTKKERENIPGTIGHLTVPSSSKKEDDIEIKKSEENIEKEQVIENNQKEEEPSVPIEEKRKKKKKRRKKKRWFSRMKQTIQTIPKKIKRCLNNIEQIKVKIRKCVDFYKEEMTQKAITLVKKLVKKLVLHTLPRKFCGKIVFGTSDPALTGKILGILSIGIPIYKDTLQLYPVFDESVFRFEGKGKGKIQLGYYVYLAFCVFINKDIRYVIKKAKKILK